MTRLLNPLTISVAVGSLVVVTSASAGEVSGVRIHEVMPHSGDRDGTSLHDWLELVNTTAAEVSIAGWSIHDRDGNRFEIPAALPHVPPGAFVVVHFDGAGAAEDDLDFSDGMAALHTAPELVDLLDDEGDHVSLRSRVDDDPDRIGSPLVDFVAYGSPRGGDALGAVEEAVRAGLWRPHGRVRAEIGFGARPEDARPIAGRSIGLRPGAVSTSRHDSVHDWSAYEDAEVTPGAPNPVPRPYACTEPDGATLAADGFALGWNLVPGASYAFQLDDDPEFASPLVDAALEDTRFVSAAELPPGDYWWRVRATIEGHGSSAWSPARRIGVVAAPTAGRKGVSQERVLNITWLRQRKDTGLLCIDGDNEGNPFDPAPKLTWDAPHPSSVMPNAAIHGRNHCVRASIAMIATNYGGRLSQDRISYELFERQGNPIENVGGVDDPSEDLGHDRSTAVCGLNGSSARTLLAWALGVNANTIVYSSTSPTFDQIRAWIDAGRPVMRFFFTNPAANFGHVTVIAGYRIRKDGSREVRDLDPWSGPTWDRHDTFAVDCYYVPPASAPNVRSDEAAISLDSDGDRVLDWDERVRFGTDPLSPDSDFDGVADRPDIREYVFDAAGVYALRPADTDNDALRKELDPDNDGDGDVDGCEDRNRNGKYEVSLGETDNFDAASSQQPTDSFEPNDSDAAATPLAAGATEAYLTPGDRDFYQFTTPSGTHVYLRVRYGDHTPGFRVRARLDGIAAIDATDGALDLDRSFIPTGRHVLEIFGEDSRTRSCYTIEFGTSDAVLRPWSTLPDPPLLRYLVPWREPLVATYPWNPEIIDQYRRGAAPDPLPAEFAVLATLETRDLDVYLRTENGRPLDFALFAADGGRIATAQSGGRPRGGGGESPGVITSDGHIRVLDLPAGTYVISIGPGDFETVFELGVGSAALDVGFSPGPVSSPDPSLAAHSPQIVTEVPAGELGRAEVYVNVGSRLPVHGVKGWSLGIELEGDGEIVEVDTLGTAAEPAPGGLLRDGLATARPIEPGPNGGRRGVVAAAVLGIEKLATLPRVGAESILRLVVESTRPQGGEDQILRLRPADGLVGDGEPVESVFTVRYSSERPANLDTAAVALRFVREPTRGSTHLGFSPQRISSPLAFDGVVGHGLPGVAETELVAAVAAGRRDATTVHVDVVSELDNGSGAIGSVGRGVVGWSIALELEGDAEIVSATTAGTTAARPPDGIREGFSLTQVIDPSRNGGRRGVISAVVLFDLDPVSLPPVGTESILRIALAPSSPQGSVDRLAALSFTDGLVGFGTPTRTVLTIDETSQRAANQDEAGLTVRFVEGPGPVFWRGDTNPDGVLDITDAVVSLGHQFLGRPAELDCEKSADFNDDDVIDITDPISLLAHLFLGASAPGAPYPECGVDPTEDGLDCERFPPCRR